MSCFIVNGKILARMANYICAHINNGFNCTHLYLDISDEFKKLVSDKNGNAVEGKVFDELYKLNLQSFKERYEGRHLDEVENCTGKFAQYDNPPIGMFDSEINEHTFQMFKSMECYLYQCSDLEKPDDSVVYREISRMKNALMSRIIHNLAEYKAAEWD